MSPSAESLHYFYQLLGLSRSPDFPTYLVEDQFWEWKPLVEQMARTDASKAEEMASVLPLLADLYGDRLCQALACWIAGNVYHILSKLELAHEAYQQSESTYSSLQAPLNIARMSVGWVHVLSEQGYFEKALQRSQIAKAGLMGSEDPKDKERLAILYGNLGIVYEQLGRLVEALTNYEHKWRYYSALLNPSIDALIEGAMALNDIGVVQVLLGQYNDADQSFRSAQKQLATLPNTPSLRTDLTLLFMNLAWLAISRHSSPESVRKAFRQARKSRDQLSEATARLNFILLELDEANWLLRNQLWYEVDYATLEKQKALAADNNILFEAAYAQMLLGQLAYYQGKMQEAYESFEQLEHETINNIPTLAYLARLWQARILRQMDADTSVVERMLKGAIAIVEQTRQKLTLDDYRAGYLEDKLLAYQELTQLYLAQGNHQAALTMSEHNKSRTLAEAIGSSVTQAQAETIHFLVDSTLLEAVIARLPSDVLVISYMVINEQVWAFLLDREHGLLDRPQLLGKGLTRSESDNGLRNIRQIAYEKSPFGAALAEQIALAQGSLQAWYAAYIAPLQPWLQRYPRLLISPDGLLNTLPFACLYNQVSKKYLIETHEIVFAPSLAVWFRLPHVQQVAENVLVIGNSSYNGVVGTLPRTVLEAQTIAKLFPQSNLLIERAATFAQFTRFAPQSGLIYIAAHGEYRIGEPAASFIELVDQPLSVRHILSLNLPGTVVILSACETSKGHLTGNEMMGLVRAFLYAGASNVVATHWQVEDNATFSLMTNFMQEVAIGCPLSAALKQAQCQALWQTNEPTSHPFYWGALSLTGTISH